MKNMIEVKGLCKSYPDFALKHVSFQVPGGSIMGLIGENGAGKTTTLKSLLGLTRFEGGEVFLLGCPVPQRERTVKQDVGMVLDDCFFHDALKAREIDKILAPVFRNWDSGLFRDYLNKFKLPEKKLVKEYSRGMKMKLSLAAALAHHPRLLILDEATAGLDPVVRDEILNEFLGFIGSRSAVQPHHLRPGEGGRLHHLSAPGRSGAVRQQGYHFRGVRPGGLYRRGPDQNRP